MEKFMMKYMNLFEKVIITILIVMMSGVIFISTIELGGIIIKNLASPPVFFFGITELMDAFGLFLLILIGLELLETIKVYIMENTIHVEVVILVAIMALARKVIILDFKNLDSLMLVGIGILIISLSVGYYLIKLSHKSHQ